MPLFPRKRESRERKTGLTSLSHTLFRVPASACMNDGGRCRQRAEFPRGTAPGAFWGLLPPMQPTPGVARPRRSRPACPVSRLSGRLRPPAFRTRREPSPQGSPPILGQPVRWSRTWRRQLNQHGRLQQARQSPPGHLLPLRGCWDSSRRHAECPASPRAAHPGPTRRPEAPRRNRGRRICRESPALSSISRFFFSSGMAVSSPVSIAAPIISKATLENS